MDQLINLLANEEVIDVDEGTPPNTIPQTYPVTHQTHYRVISPLRAGHPKQQPGDAQSPCTISRNLHQRP